MPHLRWTRKFSHRVLTNRHGVRHPVRKRWRGYGLVFDRIYRIEGGGRNAEDAEITRRARREEETPIVGKATLTLRRTIV